MILIDDRVAPEEQDIRTCLRQSFIYGQQLTEIVMNICIKCNELKELDEFCKDRTKKTGYKNTCKACQREYLREWRKNNPNYMKGWYARHPRWREMWRRNHPDYMKDYRQMLKDEKSSYWVWRGIKQRCLNSSHKSYPYYGGRGIKVCDRWAKSYDNFILDMGNRPTPEHEIDRIDNNGHYNKANCRWATRLVNARNTSACKLTKQMVSYAKELHYKGWCYDDISDILGVQYHVVSSAIQGITYG